MTGIGTNPNNEDNWVLVLEFLNKVVDAVDVGPADVQFGFVMFSQFSRNEFFLDTYRNKVDVKNAILGLEETITWDLIPTPLVKHCARLY